MRSEARWKALGYLTRCSGSGPPQVSLLFPCPAPCFIAGSPHFHLGRTSGGSADSPCGREGPLQGGGPLLRALWTRLRPQRVWEARRTVRRPVCILSLGPAARAAPACPLPSVQLFVTSWQILGVGGGRKSRRKGALGAMLRLQVLTASGPGEALGEQGLNLAARLLPGGGALSPPHPGHVLTNDRDRQKRRLLPSLVAKPPFVGDAPLPTSGPSGPSRLSHCGHLQEAPSGRYVASAASTPWGLAGAHALLMLTG